MRAIARASFASPATPARITFDDSRCGVGSRVECRFVGCPSDPRGREDRRLDPCVLGNPRQHARADLVAVVEREHNIGPAIAFEREMRAALAFHAPADALQCGEHAPCLMATTHAPGSEMLTATGLLSPSSSRSASTRRASVSAFRLVLDAAEASTPGSSGTSAIQPAVRFLLGLDTQVHCALSWRGW